MLLHGAGKTRRDWHKLGYVDRLKAEFTVVSVDLRGTGESDFLTEIADYQIEKLCGDLYSVADACGLDRFLVWGYSFGGNVARYLGAWSDRPAALAVIGIPFGPAVDDEFDRFIHQFVAKWQPSVEAYRTGAAMEKRNESVIKARIPVWVACFQAMRSWPAIMPEDLHCPALLLAGTKNQAALKWARAHQAALDRAKVQVEVVDGLNHSQEFTHTERVFPAVSTFLRRHNSAE